MGWLDFNIIICIMLYKLAFEKTDLFKGPHPSTHPVGPNNQHCQVFSLDWKGFPAMTLCSQFINAIPISRQLLKNIALKNWEYLFPRQVADCVVLRCVAWAWSWQTIARVLIILIAWAGSRQTISFWLFPQALYQRYGGERVVVVVVGVGTKVSRISSSGFYTFRSLLQLSAATLITHV